MRRRLGLILVAVLFAVLAFLAWPILSGGGRLGAKPASVQASWKTEEEWLVDSIVRDLVEMAAFSSGRAGTTSAQISMIRPAAGSRAPLAFAVSLPGSQSLRLETVRAASVWSPQEYEALASGALAALKEQPGSVGTATEGSLSVTEELTSFEPAVIEAVNDRVSKALGRDMRDFAAHEAAALVLEALALREAADSYSDIRATLCRATAHLAFAAALRKGRAPTTDGRIALVAHFALAGRGADAEDALRDLEEHTPSSLAAGAWARALRLRLFEDTRGIEVPATLLERRELYRAWLRTVDPARALEQAALLGLAHLTDAWRLASEVGLSVETGNALLPGALDREIQEAREVFRRREGEDLAEGRLVDELNRVPERLVTADGPRVISRGSWAAHHQRHIINSLARRNFHLREMLGLYAEADAHRKEVAARFGQLSLGTLLMVRLALDATKGPGPLDGLIELAAQRPEWIPAGHWFAVEQVAAYEVVRQGMPEGKKWFVPGVPRGTAFDVAQRGFAGLLPRDKEEMRRLHALSPADFEVTRALLGALYRDKVPSAEISRLQGGRSLYDIRVLDGLVAVSWGQPADLGPHLARTCQIVPDRCFNYGFHLVTQGQDAAAAAAYRRGFDGAADGVLASNNVRWLVLQYLKDKKNADAYEVAQKAAQVGSYGGLRTLSLYLEYTGDFEGAERLLQDARERYGGKPKMPEDLAEAKDGEQDEDDLLTFYYRMAFVRLAKPYEEKFWQLARDDFPRGLEKLERASLSGRPEEGVMLLTVSDQGTAAGVRQGDIVVGLNGHRIRSRRQYFLVLDFTDEPDFLLDVFRHPAYLQIPARSPGHRLGLSMRTLGR